MVQNGMLYRIVTVFAVTLEISAVFHWRVTEHGRIQSEDNSVFDMRRPDDFVSFMDQEKRSEKATALYDEISKKEISIDNQFIDLDMTNIEKSNSECFSSDKPINVDIHASIVIDPKFRDGIDSNDLMLYNIVPHEEQTEPNCENTFPLNFSIYTFEHFKAMQNRKNLVQYKEPSLMKHLPPNTDINQFSHQLAYSLSQNKTSWIYLNLASIYWRIKGHAYNALECSRRAIVCAPRQYRDIPLLTTAGILHAVRYSGEAAIILHAAIDLNPLESYHHLALGHIYTFLGDHERSVACYDNCLKLSPEMTEAKQMKHAIQCHHLLEMTLISVDQRLRKLLSLIRAYYDSKEEWFKLYEHILWEQNIKPSTREMKLALARKQNRYSFTTNPIKKSSYSIGDDVVLSYTDIEDKKKLAENMLQNVHLSLHLVKNVHKVKDLNHVAQATDKLMKLNMEHNVFESPTKNPKYQNVEIKRGNGVFETENWPQISDCNGSILTFSEKKQYLPVYLPPENKGYATHLFVNELIDIKLGKKHPLPWRPPICQTPKSYNNKYITRFLLNVTVKKQHSDVSLKPLLHNLVQTAELAEIGQRILTATEGKVAAPWVLSMLASLYWRIVGKSRLALDCLQLALDGVPSEFRDVPLVSIASLHHKVGLIDNALRIANEALQINAVEPMTNFLFGILLNIKGNYTGAMHYLKQALRMDPHLHDGRALMLLKTLACYEKFDVFTRNEPETSSYEVHEVRLLNASYDKKKHKRFKFQDSSFSNNVFKLPELYIDANKISNYISNMNLSNYQYKSQKIPINPSFDIIVSKDMLNSHGNWMIFGISDNQKELYFPNKDECDKLKQNWTSTLWIVFHEFLRRNMTTKDLLESVNDNLPILQPMCERGKINLQYVTELMRLSQLLKYNVELNMIEWLMMITEMHSNSLEVIGTKLAYALRKHSSWPLAIAASFYWRVIGDSQKALDCIWQSLENIPKDSQDILFVNIASLLSSQDYFEEALDIAQVALEIAPNFVVNHYVIGNLYAVTGNFKAAINYYTSSLELDSNFEPTITRLKMIKCFLFFDDQKYAMSKLMDNIL